jgi:hypothetical protein
LELCVLYDSFFALLLKPHEMAEAQIPTVRLDFEKLEKVHPLKAVYVSVYKRKSLLAACSRSSSE